VCVFVVYLCVCLCVAGGYGYVFVAQDTQTGVDYALKVEKTLQLLKYILFYAHNFMK